MDYADSMEDNELFDYELDESAEDDSGDADEPEAPAAEEPSAPGGVVFTRGPNGKLVATRG